MSESFAYRLDSEELQVNYTSVVEDAAMHNS